MPKEKISFREMLPYGSLILSAGIHLGTFFAVEKTVAKLETKMEKQDEKLTELKQENNRQQIEIEILNVWHNREKRK